MNENNTVPFKKVIWKPILAAIFVIAGIFCCAKVSSAEMNVNKITANQITESDDAMIDNIYVLGKMGTKETNGVEYDYYIILAQDKGQNRFTMGIRASKETSAEFEKIAQSGTSEELGYALYGAINAMDEETAQVYDSLLEEYGYAATYPNLYFTFIDSGNSSGLNGLLGIICMIPFLGISAYLCYSFYVNITGKSKKQNQL